MGFITAQILGVIVLFIVTIGPQQKTKERILICQMAANLIEAVEYFILNTINGNGLTASMMAIVNTIRCAVFFYYKKKNMKPSLTFLIIFIIIGIISGALTWKNGLSIIPMFATIVMTYGLWQDNVKITRICTTIVAMGWIAYNYVAMAYTTIIKNVSEATSAIISIIRHHVIRKDLKEGKIYE